jgi:hypothetical protein
MENIARGSVPPEPVAPKTVAPQTKAGVGDLKQMQSSRAPLSAAEAKLRSEAEFLQQALADRLEELGHPLRGPKGATAAPAEAAGDATVANLVRALNRTREQIANLRRNPPQSPPQMLEP